MSRASWRAHRPASLRPVSAAQDSGQYVGYTFFRVDPAWRRLPVDERAAGKEAFAEVVQDWAGRMDALRAYSVTGVRPDADFFLWKITQRYDDLGELGAALLGVGPATWCKDGSCRRQDDNRSDLDCPHDPPSTS